MRKLILLLIFVIFLTNFVNAQSIEVEEEVVRNIILLDDTAEFKVTIHNNQGFSDTIRTSTLNIDWNLATEPEKIEIDAKSSKEILLKLTPKDIDKAGNYAITLIFSSLKNEVVRTTHLFNVNILNLNEIVEVSLEVPPIVSPDKKNLIKFHLNNPYNIEYEDLSLELYSDFFSQSQTTSLLPYETKEINFEVELEGEIKEGDYPLKARVYYNNELAIEEEFEMTISHSPEISEIKTPEQGFLLKRTKLTKTNNGKTISHEILTYSLTRFQKTFSNIEPEPDKVELVEGAYVLTWEFDLKPDETKEVMVEVSYRSLLYLLIIIIVVVLLIFYFYKRDLSISKKIMMVKHTKEGTQMKILLNIKNKTNKSVKGIKVLDSVLNIVEEPTNFGTIKPDKILKTASGRRLIFDIFEMRPHEERVISYTAKTKVHVIGKIVIPKAIARYRSKKILKVVRSNKVKLFS